MTRFAWPLVAFALAVLAGCGANAGTSAAGVSTAGTSGTQPAAEGGRSSQMSAAQTNPPIIDARSAAKAAANGGAPAAAEHEKAATAGSAADGGGGTNGQAMAAGGGAPAEAGAGAPATTSCTRESLHAQVDLYFTALAAHEPGMLQQAPNLKVTENAMTIQLGEGLIWKSASAAKFTRSLYDTERCGTVTEAVVPNAGDDTIYGVRLQLADQKLSEIETIVVDPKNGFAVNPQGILSSKAEVWEDVLPAEQRNTRAVLEAAGTAYFTWFADSSMTPPFDKPCDRLENGTKTTQGTCDNLGGAMGLKHPAQRYPLSDLEAGLTAGFVLFAGADIDFHMFKVVSGKIQRINAVVGPAVRSAGW